MSKYTIHFRDGLKSETIEADTYIWYHGGQAVFSDRAHCEHETTIIVAQFDGSLIRSIRIAE